jgi:hypothetical protein
VLAGALACGACACRENALEDALQDALAVCPPLLSLCVYLDMGVVVPEYAQERRARARNARAHEQRQCLQLTSCVHGMPTGETDQERLTAVKRGVFKYPAHANLSPEATSFINGLLCTLSSALDILDTTALDILDTTHHVARYCSVLLVTHR